MHAMHIASRWKKMMPWSTLHLLQTFPTYLINGLTSAGFSICVLLSICTTERVHTHHIVSCHWQCNHMEIVIISSHLSCNQFSSSAKEITRFCRRRLIKRMKLSVRREAHKINIGIIQVKNTRFWNGMRWSERKMKESEDWGKIAYVAIFYCAFYLYITS